MKYLDMKYRKEIIDKKNVHAVFQNYLLEQYKEDRRLPLKTLFGADPSWCRLSLLPLAYSNLYIMPVLGDGSGIIILNSLCWQKRSTVSPKNRHNSSSSALRCAYTTATSTSGAASTRNWWSSDRGRSLNWRRNPRSMSSPTTSWCSDWRKTWESWWGSMKERSITQPSRR